MTTNNKFPKPKTALWYPIITSSQTKKPSIDLCHVLDYFCHGMWMKRRIPRAGSKIHPCNLPPDLKRKNRGESWNFWARRVCHLGISRESWVFSLLERWLEFIRIKTAYSSWAISGSKPIVARWRPGIGGSIVRIHPMHTEKGLVVRVCGL